MSALQAMLRDDHFGAVAWSAVEPGVRRFLPMAERTLRDHQRDPAADLSPVIVGYGEAAEMQANAIIRIALCGAPDVARRVKLTDATGLLPDALPLTLAQLARVLGGEPELGERLRRMLSAGTWYTGEFAVTIDGFVDEACSPAAHGEPVARAVVLRRRIRLLGAGCEGAMCRLARVHRR